MGTGNPWVGKAAVARFPRLLAALALVPLYLGCDRSASPAAGTQALVPDSLVADLFTVGSAMWRRDGAAVLTPRGQSLLRPTEFDTLGDAVIFPAPAGVGAFSAYVRRERDLACGDGPARDDALLIRYDDGLPGYCHDTLFAWIPAYPYTAAIPASYAEGRGFWVTAGSLPLARGALVIRFERPRR